MREGFAAHLRSVSKRRKAALGKKTGKSKIQERKGRLRRARVILGFPKEQSNLRCRCVTGERAPADHTINQLANKYGRGARPVGSLEGGKKDS